MHRLYGISLRQLLTLPYVVLLIVCTMIIGLLSYLAGRDAVDSLSNKVLVETVSRIAQTVDKHIAGSEAVLETAFPSGVAAPATINNDVDTLRNRLWLATSIHRDLNNYAYYGNEKGQFIGLYRHTENEAELRLRLDDSVTRSIYRYSGIDGDLLAPENETRWFEPRERPWYETGKNAHGQTWTRIYIDFKTMELVATRTQRINDDLGKFAGVVATDVSLHQLDEFLDGIKLSGKGFAFIVEPDGNLIATSIGPHIRQDANNNNVRLNASNSSDPLIRATYETVKQVKQQSGQAFEPSIGSFKTEGGSIVQTGYVSLHNDAGLDWIVAVAVPRSDYMHQITSNVHRTAFFAILACASFGLVGYAVLHIISRDLSLLAGAARDLGDGIIDSRIPIHRTDEIGDLARSFQSLRKKLMTDQLTGIANREAVVRKIEDRIVNHRRRYDARPFAILFIDLNGFKKINDQIGHDMGDRVLQEIGHRLKASLRSDDLAARYGGDEFVVVLDWVNNYQDALSVRRKLTRALSFPLKSLKVLDEVAHSLRITAAIGMALCPDDGNDLETLLSVADADMYDDKKPAKIIPWVVS